MKFPAISALARAITQNESSIPEQTVVDALHEVHGRFLHSKYRHIANQLCDGAGEYLPPSRLSDFIDASLSDDEALSLIQRQRAYIDRARYLLGAILKALKLKGVEDARLALQLIDDCCHDFPLISQAKHEKRVRREVKHDVQTLRTALQEVRRLLPTVARQTMFDAEFVWHQEALTRISKNGRSAMTIDELGLSISDALFCLELMRERERQGTDPYYITDNRARGHVVDCAYDLAIHFGHPRFVTSPGSEFSHLCSLLFELASGHSDEGLAGAINHFSRSAERAERDNYLAQSQYENSEEARGAYEADNFSGWRERAKGMLSELEFLQSTLNGDCWDASQRQSLLMRLADVLQRKDDLELIHGPFLVWAHQSSEGNLEAHRAQILEMMERELTLKVDLGKLRRQARLSTSNSNKPENTSTPG